MAVLAKRAAEPSQRDVRPRYLRVPAYLIRRLQLISVAVIAEAFEGEDMPVPQWATLTIIHSHPDIDQSRLSQLVSIDRTNTGRLVDQLEAKGLIERRPSGADRRVWMLRRRTRSRGGYDRPDRPLLLTWPDGIYPPACCRRNRNRND